MAVGPATFGADQRLLIESLTKSYSFKAFGSGGGSTPIELFLTGVGDWKVATTDLICVSNCREFRIPVELFLASVAAWTTMLSGC